MTTRVPPVPSFVLALCCGLALWLSLTRAPASTPALPPGARAGDAGPSRAIFPPRVMPLRFSHRRHVLELRMACTACHDRSRTSTHSADSLLPAPARCDGCHGSDHSRLERVTAGGLPMGACKYCHVGYEPEHGNLVARVVTRPPNLHFNHALHMSQPMRCSDCHGAVEQTELATREQLPRMSGCLRCHGGQAASASSPAAPGGCATCHVSEGGRLKTDFAFGALLPPQWLRNAEHGADWIERHRHVAGNDSQFCANCHSEKECADCHDGRVRPRRRVHPNDFLSQHAVAARQNSQNCASCHRQQSFCASCHQRVGVTLSGPYENFSKRGRIHPPKSVWTDGARSSRHHAWEAQRNLNACISCHTERDCASCHSTRGVGGRGAAVPLRGGRGTNPHPADFRRRCGRALRQNARPCLVCHEPVDPKLRECR